MQQPTTAPEQKTPNNAPTGASGGQPVPRAAQNNDANNDNRRQGGGGRGGGTLQPDNGPHHEVTYPVGSAGVRMEEAPRTVGVEEPPPMPVNEKLNSIGKPTPR